MAPPAPQSILRTATGDIFLTTTNPFRPLHFDAEGRFIGELGREGQGPGEYTSAFWIAGGLGDTVWIFDMSLRRRNAWSPTGTYLATRPHGIGEPHSVILEDGDLVVSSAVMTPRSIGRPLHRTDPDGELRFSFGPEVRVETGGHPPGWIRRILATSADGTIWAGHHTEYRIERFTPDGDLVQTLARNVDWFPSRDPSVRTRLAEDGPQPALRSIVEDGRGWLRAVFHLPREGWRQGLGERELQPGFEAAGVYWTPILDHRLVYTFIIEILDPETGRVVASHHGEGLSLGWLDDRHIATYREDDFSIPIIEIFRVDVTGG